MARIESGELRFDSSPVDLTDLAAQATAQVTIAGGPTRVRVDVAGDVPAALGDDARLLQVLVNLLSNALKFSPDESPVVVRVRRQDREVRVDVVDQGAGVATADHELLFQRFSRLRRTGGQDVKGTGLGLYICKSFVEAQGGRIWVESVSGAGATFSFAIPVAQAGAG